MNKMASSKLLSSRKSDTVLGTFESDAFLLSLRNDTEVCLLHEYGYHRIPHIGVYGEFYSPCLPLVLISLPAVKKIMEEQFPSSVLQVLYPGGLPEPMEVVSLPTSPVPATATAEEDSTLPPNGSKCEEDNESNLKLHSNDGSQEERIENATATANTTTTATTTSAPTSTTTTTSAPPTTATTTTSAPTTTTAATSAPTTTATTTSAPTATATTTRSSPTTTTAATSAPTTTAATSAPTTTATTITVPPSPSHSTDHYGCTCCSANEADEAGCLLRVCQFLVGVVWKSFELDRCMHRERTVPPPSPVHQLEAAPVLGKYGRLVGEVHCQYETGESSPTPLGDPEAECPTLESASAQHQDELSDRTVSFQVESNTDFFIVFHPFPPPSPCQKFLCDNTDEINLVYHCWMYPDAPYSEDYTRTEQLPMGVFEAHGVRPVHQNLKDAGVAFDRLEERTVCVHDCRFSPENAQMQLTHETSVITFFSVAKNQEHQVVTYHVVCGNDKAETALKESLRCAQTLGDLLQAMQKEDMFQDCVKTVERLVLPLAVAPQWSQSPSD